jgi:hypothetical protein
MNENIPTPQPDDQSGTPLPVPAEYKMPPPRTPPESEGPGTGTCIALGVLLCIVSTGLCLLIPPIFLAGLAVAIGSLFVKGYRGVFLGFILAIGVALLGAIIYCAGHPLNV